MKYHPAVKSRLRKPSLQPSEHLPDRELSERCAFGMEEKIFSLCIVCLLTVFTFMNHKHTLALQKLRHYTKLNIIKLEGKLFSNIYFLGKILQKDLLHVVVLFFKE